MSANASAVASLPTPPAALLAMLGCQPDDDAWVLGQSGPALTPATSAALAAWRLQHSVRLLLVIAPVWAASLQSAAASETVIAALAGHPWQPFLRVLWPAWRQAVLAEHDASRSDSEWPELEQILLLWQREHERCWQQLSAAETVHLLATASMPVPVNPLSAIPLSANPLPVIPLPPAWQASLHRMAMRAGVLAAQALQQPCAAEPGRRECRWQQQGARLYRYPAAADATPVLLVYAWINRPEVLDLGPQQSLIAAMQAEGLAVWLLDWADSGAHGLSLDHYLTALLTPALEVACCESARERIAVLGICQGGTLALTLALQQQPESPSTSTPNRNRMASLSLAVTPFDFQTETDRLSAWAATRPASAFAALRAHSPALLNLAFLNLKPYSLRTGKYLALLLQEPSASALANFLRLEHWLLSGPLLSGPGIATYLERYYHRNVLCHLPQTRAAAASTLLPMPVQVLIADQDHIVPPAASLALLERLPVSTPVQVDRLPSGHIGVLVGRARLQLAARVAAFVRQHHDAHRVDGSRRSPEEEG